jgi:hypothetical protein
VEEVTALLARAYATTHPDVLLTEVRRRAAEVSAMLDQRSTLAQRRRLLVAGGWLALLGATCTSTSATVAARPVPGSRRPR